MNFDRHICWHRQEAAEVLDPEADNIADQVFLAVHSERPLAVALGGYASPDAAKTTPWPQAELLEAFLDPSRHHVKAVVLGKTGTGKSHLIRWLQLNIPSSRNRKVVVVPKSGTSLRGILQRIIAELPADSQASYAQRLAESPFDVEPENVRRQRLVANIGLAIMADQPAAGSEEEEYLVGEERLPLIFQHPVLGRILTRDDGVIADLVQHISGSDRYQRRERDRTFQLSDLPLTGFDLKNDLDSKTRDVVTMLKGDAGVQQVALEIINRNLRPAIQRILNFTGDQLGELMTDVRRYLASQGQELVILIEDLTRMQGLDQALIDALVVGSDRQTQGDLSVLRWAAAVTTGYYLERVDPTVRTRLDFLIDLDVMAERAITSPEEDLSRFSAKYLNAARVPGSTLADWGAAVQQGLAPDLPNPCDPCPFRQECHAAFGAVEEVGLYPFSRLALERMMRRVNARYEDEFNPRELIAIVLRDVLVNRRPQFESKTFPAKRPFEPSRLKPGDRNQILTVDTRDGQRREIVIDLWAPEGDLNGPEGILRAFGLRPLVIDQSPRPPEPTPELQDSRAAQLDPRIAAIRSWGNGAVMPESTAQYLRALVYDAVTSHIDWDAEGMERTFFTRRSGGSFFQARHISFANQETATAPGAVTLRIPSVSDEAGLRQAAIVLEGLVEWQQRGDLETRDGFDTIVDTSHQIASWADEVLRGLRPIGSGRGPDSAIRAADLLVLGAFLGGTVPANAEPAVVVDRAFGDWPADLDWATPEWKQVYERLLASRPSLREVAISRLVLTKGGRTDARLLDATSMLAMVTSLCAPDWEAPTGGEATSATAPLTEVSRVAQLVAEKAEQAVRGAWMQQVDWYRSLEAADLSDVAGDALRSAFEQVKTAADRAGLAYSPSRGIEFTEQVQAFSGPAFDATRTAIKDHATSPRTPPPSFVASPPRMAAIEQWRSLLAAFEAYERELRASLEVATSKDGLLGSIDRRKKEISAGLERTTSALRDLEKFG